MQIWNSCKNDPSCKSDSVQKWPFVQFYLRLILSLRANLTTTRGSSASFLLGNSGSLLGVLFLPLKSNSSTTFLLRCSANFFGFLNSMASVFTFGSLKRENRSQLDIALPFVAKTVKLGESFLELELEDKCLQSTIIFFNKYL